MDKGDFLVSRPEKGGIWDVIIIGSGPAALTAAVYTTRGFASTLIIAGEKWGGQLMLTTKVDNFPGFPEGIGGPDLMLRMKKQSERFGALFLEEDAQAVSFSTENKNHLISTRNGKYRARSIIIATGAETKWLNVPGEDRLRGRGVSSCAPCDAMFFKDKKVAVVGGGDSAMEEALILSKYASLVYIIHRSDEFSASKVMQEKVMGNKKVKIFWNREVVEFLGSNSLEGVKVKDNKSGEISEIKLGGVFVAIGHKPSTKLFEGKVKTDKKGYVIKGKNSTAEGYSSVFVAGDVYDFNYRQAITAAGLGCMAGMDAVRRLDELREKN